MPHVHTDARRVMLNDVWLSSPYRQQPVAGFIFSSGDVGDVGAAWSGWGWWWWVGGLAGYLEVRG